MGKTCDQIGKINHFPVSAFNFQKFAQCQLLFLNTHACDIYKLCSWPLLERSICWTQSTDIQIAFVVTGLEFTLWLQQWRGCIKVLTVLDIVNPKLDTMISVRSSSVTLRGPRLKSETGWTGELWSNGVLLIFEN